MRSRKFAGVHALLGLAGALGACGPAKEVGVELRFGSGKKLGSPEVAAVASAGCPIPLFLAVRGPGIPRTRVPLLGATVDNISTFGGSGLNADLTIPDQVVKLPAGPARVLTIGGRMDISEDANCTPGTDSYPIHGELGPVDIAADAEGVTLEFDVLLSNEPLDVSGTLSWTPSSSTGFQKVSFDLSAFSADFAGCTAPFTRMRVRDLTIDGPAFRMAANLGSAVSVGVTPSIQIGPLLPFRLHRIELQVTCSAGDTRVLGLLYRTPRSDNERGTSSDSAVHSATCARTDVREGVCRRN